MTFLFILLFILFAVIAVLFGAFNSSTLVAIHTPFWSDHVVVTLLVPLCIGGGMLLTFCVMTVQQLLQRGRMRQRENELMRRLKEKEEETNQIRLRAHNAENRLFEYEAQVREFTLQVLHLSHALRSDRTADNLALPEELKPHDATGDTSHQPQS